VDASRPGAASLDDLASLRGEIEGIAQEVGGAAQPGELTPSFAFGIPSGLEVKAAAILTSIRDTLAKLAPATTVETVRDGRTARTVLHYSGRAASVWSGGTTQELLDAHLDSLRSTYAFRAAVVALLAAVGNALLAISAAAANPLKLWHAVRSAEALKAAVDRLAEAVAQG
jgi:hypothetical protein